MMIWARITHALVFAMMAITLAGCPSTDPDPDPDPDPETRSVFFRLPRTFATGDGPDAVTTGDLNGDAYPDIAVVNALEDTVDYWLSTGAGAYANPKTLETGGVEPRALLLADLDEDGLTDILTANAASNDVSILYGLGEGRYAAAVLVALPDGAIPRDVALLDANGDGLLDVLSANSGLGTVSLAIALAEGGFDAPLDLVAGEGVRALRVADLNNDTLDDVVAANRDTDSLSVFMNDSSGLFQEVRSIPTGTSPRLVQASDLDHDGWLDLLVSNPGSASIGIHMGAGAGEFEPVVFTALDANPSRFAIEDFTGDGNTDILAILFASSSDTVSSGELLLLAGSGRGQFTPGPRYHVGAGIVDVVASDVDRDGAVDVVGCNLTEDTMLLVEARSGGLLDAERRFAAGVRPRTVVAGDLNRDSNPDLVVGNLNSDEVTVMLGNGTGAFAAGTNYDAGGSARALALGLINGDNNLDLAVTNLDESRVAVRLGRGDGTFGPAVTFSTREAESTRSAEPRSIALADMNEDGKLDMVVGNANLDSVAILIGDGNGGFDDAVEYEAGNFPLDVHVADLDDDGNLDVALINGADVDGTGTQTPAVRTLPGKGDGTLDLEAMTAYVAVSSPGSLAVADIDSDGDPDLVTSHRLLDSVQLYLNRGDGSFGGGGSAAVGDAPNTVGVADLNGDGRPDLYTTNDDGTVSVRLRRSSLLYERAETVSAGSLPIGGLAVDLNGDTRRDLVLPNRDTGDISILLGKTG